ncbi:MAG: PAS domain S-box protein [Vicinamibacteria bacterium]|nr:PAS domain S-box protein [Vicinamibacteria bacterium]
MQTQGPLRDREAWTRSIIETAMDGFWLATTEGRLLEVNEAYCRMSGYTRAELLALTIPDLDVTLAEGDPAPSSLVARVIEQGEHRFETRHRRKDGTIFDVEVSVQYRTDSGGRLVVFLRDITERKAAAEALRASEARYRSMLDTSPDAMGLTDLEGRIRMASPAALKLVGCDRPEDLIGRALTDFLVPEDRERATTRMGEILDGRPPSPTEYTGVRFDGSKVSIEVNSQFIRGADGRPTEMILLIRDITARKHAAEALLASEEKHRLIIETAMDGFWLTDREGRLLEVNDAYCRMSGYSAAELRGMSLSELKAAELREDFPRHIRRAMEQGEARFETRHRRKDGSLFDLEVSIQYRPQGGGRFVAFQRDITNRKRAEEALRMSEGRYRSILNASPDNITITDLEARIVMVSPAGLEMMGYGRFADLAGRPISDFIASEDQERAATNIGLMFQGVFTGPAEYKARRADGSVIEVEVNGEFIRDASGKPTQLVFIARDITERKRAQASLQASEMRHRTILQTAMDGFWLVDREGRLLDVNEAYCRMSGYTPTELLGMTVGDLSRRDSGADVIAHIHHIMEQGSERFESEHRRKDGSIFSVEASVQYVPFEGGRLVAFLRDVTEQKRAAAALQQSHDMIAKLTAQVPGFVYQYRLFADGRSCFPFASPGIRSIYEVDPEEVREDASAVFSRLHPEDHDWISALILESARTLAPFHCEFRVVLPNQGLRWRLCDAMPERMEDGGTLWHGIISDITDRKQADEALRFSLKEKEGLLREVHHRVKNNLQVITSLLRLETSRSEAADTKKVLRDMQGRILSMAVLHETLYRTGRFGQVELGSYVRQLAQQLFRATGGSARLSLELAEVAVEIDQAIPCGLIVNELLTNSLKHAFAEGTEGEVKVILAQDTPDSEARLTVRDTGKGLPGDFELRRGRSLGLQLVTDLVRQIGGQIAVVPGPGAGFVVTFKPVLSHSTTAIPRPAAVPPQS